MRPALALIAAAAVLCGGGAAALAQPAGEGPMRRPGLWELKMRAEGGGARNFSMRVCVDPRLEQRHGVFGGGPADPEGRGEEPANCSVREYHSIPGGMALHSVCSSGGATMVTDATATGDYQTHYHVEVTSQRSPGGVHHTSVDGRWLGPCAAGRPGGDTAKALPPGQVTRMGPGMEPRG